ncbi:MAG: LamG domain-containing protein, partial [Chloroflexota bacterium]
MKTYFYTVALTLGVLSAQAQEPVLQWTFNDACSDSIHGDATYAGGVSGKALVFDGYHTEVVHKTDGKDLFQQDFTISAWIAPQEYAWKLSAIVNQQQELKRGFFFGIDHVGRLVGSLSAGSEWETCISTDSLPLLLWSHVAMVFNAKKGITLYINNQKVGENAFQGTPAFAADKEIVLGKTQTKLTPSYTERRIAGAIVSWMRFDGLMDEVQIFDKALKKSDVVALFNSVKVEVAQPLQFRQMPSGTDEPRPFGAYYTKLKYSPGWDALWKGSDLPDIVVRFTDSPVKLVFWRGTGYIPALVTENGIWMSDQSVENWKTRNCYEAMGDKQCRYSHVRIIENTPARAVIHWRYTLTGLDYTIWNETDDNPGDWVDEYWTAYPDGVVARKQVLWTDFPKGKERRYYQFQETIFLNQPGTKPQDNLDDNAITFVDFEGHKASYSWGNGAPETFDSPKYKPIQIVNTKSKYKPYGIYYPNRVAFPFNFGWVEGYS